MEIVFTKEDICFHEVFEAYTAGQMSYREAYEHLDMNGFDARYWLDQFRKM